VGEEKEYYKIDDMSIPIEDVIDNCIICGKWCCKVGNCKSEC
jgi:hypothetical protein